MTGIGFGGGIDLCQEQLVSKGLWVLDLQMQDVRSISIQSACAIAPREGIAGLHSRPVRGLC